MFATCNASAPYAVEERLASGDTRWVAIRARGAFANAPKLELFARKARIGWDVWGTEAPAL